MTPTGILKPNDTSGPAFPMNGADGMTLRDYFAAQALIASLLGRVIVLTAGGTSVANDPYAAVANDAYRYADALLEERVK